jgi:hypothetical protein
MYHSLVKRATHGQNPWMELLAICVGFWFATVVSALAMGIAGLTVGPIRQAHSDLAGGVRSDTNSLNGGAMFAFSGGIP